MLYFVRNEYLLGGWLKTHSVHEFDDAATAIDFATSQTGNEIVSTTLYTNEEAA